MAGSKAVQVLEILKKISDESHPVTQAELLEAMRNMDGVAATKIQAHCPIPSMESCVRSIPWNTRKKTIRSTGSNTEDIRRIF